MGEGKGGQGEGKGGGGGQGEGRGGGGGLKGLNKLAFCRFIWLHEVVGH